MNKIEKIYTALVVIFIIIIFMPAEIAVYKGWKYMLRDAINWDGNHNHIIKNRDEK